MKISGVSCWTAILLAVLLASFAPYEGCISLGHSAQMERKDSEALHGAEALKIKLWTRESKSVFDIGESINFMFVANRDCHVTLIDFGTDRKVETLFPNKWHDSNRIEKDKIYRIPPKDVKFLFRIDGPAGQERVMAVATLRPVKLRELEQLKSQRSTGTSADPSALFKAIQTELSQQGKGTWATAELGFRVVEPGKPWPLAAEPERKREAPEPGREERPKPTHDEAELTPEKKPPVQTAPSTPQDSPQVAWPVRTKKKVDLLAVSLRVLQDKLKECNQKNNCPGEYEQLFGIKEIKGYIIDKRTNDIVLVGRKDTDSPPLNLDDLVVAVRNDHLKYAELRGNTYIYSDPGCSIDPDPEVMKKLNKETQCPSNTESGIKRCCREQQPWVTRCDSPQKVRVFGVPFDSHFAKVAVEADYYMKRLVQGSERLNVKAFESHSDLTVHKTEEELKSGKKAPATSWVYNRFWFAAGRHTFREGENSAWLDESAVVLLTEEELLTKTGDQVRAGKPNPLAKKFADGFTNSYLEIAGEKPIYKELHNLYKMVAIARLMKLKNAMAVSNLDLDYFLTKYPLKKYEVPAAVPGLSHFVYYEYPKNKPKYFNCLRQCGGVRVDVKVNDGLVAKGETPEMSEVDQALLKERPSEDSLFWTVTVASPLED